MLQFTGSIAFGVNIGNFLQLQCAFHRQREGRAATEIKHMIDLGQFMAHRSDLIFQLQNLIDKTWCFRKLAYQLLLTRVIDCTT